jgi:integrase/ribosomal protein L37E
MASIFSHRHAVTLKLVLARIKGEPADWPRGSKPMYDEPVPEPNRGTLLRFYRNLVTEELTIGRTAKLMGNVYRLSIWLNHKPFEEVTREDLIDLVEKIKQIKVKRRGSVTVEEGYADQTIETYKSTLRKFWKWLKPQGNPEECPPEVSWITRKRLRNRTLPEDIWTPDEVNRLAALAPCTRDRAFVLGLFGSGCRIGEFLPLKRKDVVFDDYSCQILVDGKTGPRRVRLTPAASVALAAWLDVNPVKNPEAPVWINIQVRGDIPNRHLGYDWAYDMLRGLAKRAGTKKPIRPHLLRHSLATYYAPRLTEAVMNEHFGWRQGGRTASVYTHLSGKQVDDQILAVFGKKKVDSETNRAVDVVRCWRCGLENVPTSVQCGKCGFPLSDEAARNLVQRRQKADEILDLVIRDPGVLEAIRGALAERGTTSRENSGENGPPVDAAGDACRSQGLLKASIASDSGSPTTGCSSLPFDGPCEKRLVARRVPQG